MIPQASVVIPLNETNQDFKRNPILSSSDVIVISILAAPQRLFAGALWLLSISGLEIIFGSATGSQEQRGLGVIDLFDV
jgi:hypothetical protein